MTPGQGRRRTARGMGQLTGEDEEGTNEEDKEELVADSDSSADEDDLMTLASNSDAAQEGT